MPAFGDHVCQSPRISSIVTNRRQENAWNTKLFFTNTWLPRISNQQLHFLSIHFFLINVDNIHPVSRSTNDFSQIIQLLHDAFSVRDLGPAHFLFDIEWTENSEGLLLSESKYVTFF